MTAEISKRPARVDYAYRRGDTVAEPVTILEGGLAPDITGRTYRAQLRQSVDGETYLALTVDMTTPATGGFVLRLTAAQTKLLSGRYHWDLEQNNAGVVRTLLAGFWSFDPDVSRDAPA